MRVSLADDKYTADYKVYITEWGNEKNAALIAGADLVDRGCGDVKIFVVDNEWDADICISRDHFPKRY